MYGECHFLDERTVSLARWRGVDAVGGVIPSELESASLVANYASAPKLSPATQVSALHISLRTGLRKHCSIFMTFRGTYNSTS